jgi:hypothetical protein
MTAWKLGLPLVLVLGCGETAPTPPESAAVVADQFDAASAGTLCGQVTWAGAPPVAPPFLAPVSPLGELQGSPLQLWPNPNVPAIDPQTQGVHGAVVFLRGVDPRRARPWDHGPVVVEQRDYQFHVRQRDADARTGFVRRGDEVELVTRQDAFSAFHAGGAAFFSVVFASRDRPASRRLNGNGVVELTSAAGHFWMRAYLFVDEHPYYTRTDAQGRFTLPQVPPGRYDVVCWLPDWREAGHDRDSETSHLTRLFFRPPGESVLPIVLGAQETVDLPFRVAEPRPLDHRNK